MNVDFYFDPSCPFCWITSRLLLQVEAPRQLKINWRPFSLALQNNSFSTTTTDQHAEVHKGSHAALRFIMAAAENGTTIIDLYNYLGQAFHIFDKQFSGQLWQQCCNDLKLNPELIKATSDKSYDNQLFDELESAKSIVGQDIGVPTIVIQDDNGKHGFFGPVLNQLPDNVEQSLRLWDALVTLAMDNNFYELKRSRPDGPPNVYSTAKC